LGKQEYKKNAKSLYCQTLLSFI